MDYLWTPWRYQYVTATGAKDECIFCAAAQASDDKKALVVYRAQRNFLILNRYPYTIGHLMVVPYEHAPNLQGLADETLMELILLARDCEKRLTALYRPDGLNLGMNIGRSAGAGVADHFHLHALPRWTADANFMTAIGETRVLPEDLATTWERLSAAFRERDPKPRP
jgi:ATP adenylyltransferase